MDSTQLQQLAERYRSTRESGIAILFASVFLGLFFIASTISVAPSTPAPVITVATAPTPDAFANIPLDAQAAIVYDLVTGETLYAKNSDAQLPLASLTKLLTVYAALSFLSPNTPITISKQAILVDAPRAFSTGQTLSLSDLARLTLTASLNDGASAIAEATATRKNQSESVMLAGAAAALNLSQTYAVNGSGLDVSGALSGGYGSAHDLARLAGALTLTAPDISAATTESESSAMSTDGVLFTVKNTDPIVDTLPHLLLSKTGYTDLAGGNLALVFDVGIRHPIAVVVLGSSKKARFTDGTALVAATLAHFAGITSL